MNGFRGRRVVEEYSGKVDSPRDKVFPLLCPIREYDWLDDWACTMIYSESGLAENNCIFKSEFVSGIQATWVTTKRDEENFIFEFFILFPDLAVARMDVSLAENVDGTTALKWVRTMTGITESGNQMLSHVTGDVFRRRTDWIVDSLNHYFKAGKILKRA